MALIQQTKLQNGLYWVEIPQADLRILCGTPADSIKHLGRNGFLKPQMLEGKFFYEEGPNAILLSDRLWQNEQLSNLSEFPILHMLYKQGILIPGHPHNALPKPLLIGHPKQIEQQVNYLFYGSYGVVEAKVYNEYGLHSRQISKTLSYKNRFAYGTFHNFNDLLDCRSLANEPVQLKAGVEICRKGSNLFQLAYQGETCIVDLGLRTQDKYVPTFSLPKVKLKEAHFSVVHLGEGDGWDQNRPCLASMVCHDQKKYLVDAGPNILFTLQALQMTPEDVTGVFLTHVHDDHFAGLPTLLRRNPKIKIYSSNRVFSNLVYKYASLLGLDPEEARASIQFVELMEEEWNEVEGMQIYAFPSPHPIDTSIYIFKVKGKDRDYTYGHYSDITALGWLEKMIVTQGGQGTGISPSFYDQIKKFYAKKLDVKKVDVGGLPIHGSEDDFKNDPSYKLILSHTSKPLTDKQLSIGIQAQFGEQDILILHKP